MLVRESPVTHAVIVRIHLDHVGAQLHGVQGGTAARKNLPGLTKSVLPGLVVVAGDDEGEAGRPPRGCEKLMRQSAQDDGAHPGTQTGVEEAAAG